MEGFQSHGDQETCPSSPRLKVGDPKLNPDLSVTKAQALIYAFISYYSEREQVLRSGI